MLFKLNANLCDIKIGLNISSDNIKSKCIRQTVCLFFIMLRNYCDRLIRWAWSQMDKLSMDQKKRPYRMPSNFCLADCPGWYVWNTKIRSLAISSGRDVFCSTSGPGKEPHATFWNYRKGCKSWLQVRNKSVVKYIDISWFARYVS